jgi:hypothetical protein
MGAGAGNDLTAFRRGLNHALVSITLPLLPHAGESQRPAAYQ